ncbi:MAG: LLM class F420-dependent oxidoreductase [Ilumatobacteraceae bacterium]
MIHCTDLAIAPAELAVAAEERGYESIFVTEHTHVPVRSFIRWRDGEPMPEEYKRLHDPIVALATAAAVTSTIQIGTGVLVLAQREPLATAKQLASLDVLSNGRLICGIGYGWLADELAQHGVAWKGRRRALAEHLEAVRTLWTDEEAAYSGDFVSFGPSWSFPKPLRRPPILLGAAGSPASLKDVIEFADGWMPIEGTEPITDRWQRIRELAHDRGRDPGTLGLTVYGSSGDRTTLDGHRSIGADRVVIGLAGGRDDVMRQLDLHQALVPAFQET